MELEEKIARFKNVEACVVFQSGFAANAGTVSAILGKEDFIISDELNHASIIDGARLSRAKILVFRHKDAAHAEEQLASIKDQPGHKLLITDGVFSMDGDIGPLPALCDAGGEVWRDHDGGRCPCVRRARTQWPRHHRPLQRSWARGCPGGHALQGDRRAGRICLRLARSDRLPLSPRASVPVFDIASAIRSRHLHRGVRCAGAGAASCIEKLWENTRYFKKELGNLGFNIGGKNTPASETPITPIIVGEGKLTMEFSARTVQRRRDGNRHRLPHGGEGKARIRTIMTATHTREQLDQALEILKNVGKRLGII